MFNILGARAGTVMEAGVQAGNHTGRSIYRPRDDCCLSPLFSQFFTYTSTTIESTRSVLLCWVWWTNFKLWLLNNYI